MNMSKEKSSKILGLFAILIMLHHLGQKTSAFWLSLDVRQPGLEAFVPIGYLLVSFFFFCSGYGLIKSMKTKANYFDNFLVKRLNRILLIFLITQIIYLFIRISYDVVGFPLNPYSWFIYSIIVLYIGFYLIYSKSNKYSILFMSAWIIIYSLICYVLVKGNWWINTPPVFILGIYCADNESSFPQESNRRKIYMVISALVCALSFTLSQLSDRLFIISDYDITNLIKLLLQILAAGSFSFTLYLALSTINFKDIPLLSKFLSFYAGMTLEFYLIHGLFVEIFGHHFINDTTAPIFYIKNVFLYVLVVFVLSSLSAFGLKKLCDLIVILYNKSDLFKKICADQKKNCVRLASVLIILTFIYSFYRHSLSEDASIKLEQYKKENIDYITVNSDDIAVYSAGEGNYTMVLLGSHNDCCPTMNLKPLADKLSDTYRVIIIDYPGKGFSMDSDEERTIDFFADIIHETLLALDATDNAVLVPTLTSGIYCFRYIEKYPEDVQALIGFDMIPPAISTRFLGGNYSSENEYRWYLERGTNLNGIKQKFMNITGFVGFQLPIYEYLFYGSGMKEYYPAMSEMYIRRTMQAAQINETKNLYDNCVSVEDFTLPSEFHAEFLLDNYLKTNKYYGVSWDEQYQKMITNEDNQTISITTGDPNLIYYNPSVIAKKVDEFIEGLE